jgi:DNA-binding XRE family transcriptional regulator
MSWPAPPTKSDREILAHHPNARLGLIRAREMRGISRPELARRLGVNRSQVFRFETGESSPPLALALRIIDLLGPGATFDMFRTAA